MPDFVDDLLTLATKTNLRAIPAGHDEENYFTPDDYQAIVDALYSLRTAVLAGGGGGGASSAELRITPEGPWYDSVGANLPAGRVDNYSAHPHLKTRTILCVKGADNQGTTFTGIDATGIDTGDIRILMDIQAVGQQDAGTITFKHEDPSSLAANRFVCPGQVDYLSPPNGVTLLIRGEDSRWHIFGPNGRHNKILTQSLQLYPKMLLGQAAPISGTFNDWDPTGWTGLGGFGVAGSDATFKNHSLIEIITDAAGATITGFNVQTLQTDPSYYGAIKIICNRGPGDLTLKYQDIGSTDSNRIYTPNNEDVILKAGEAAWLAYGYLDPDTTKPNWRAIALCQNRSTFPAVTVSGRTTTKTLTIGPQVSPAALPAGLTSNWNPGSGAVIKVSTTAPGSYLDGMVPESALVGNELRIIRNVGPSPLFIFDELYSASAVENKFVLPATNVVVLAVNAELAVQYQPSTGKWVILGQPARVDQTQVTLVPAAFPGTNVNNYSPTDAATGLPGRLAAWWQVSGAVGTVLTGIDAAPAGLPAYKAGDEILVTNMGSGMVVSHGNVNSLGANRVFLSGGANITLSQYGSVRFKYTGGTWLMVQKP